MDLALGILVCITIAAISFYLGRIYERPKIEDIRIAIAKHNTCAHFCHACKMDDIDNIEKKGDISDIFRIKDGPKKGLLTYRKKY